MLRNHVGTKIGAIAKPANIVFTPELPKTRSGKIMRRLLRDVAENRPLGDTTTLADPTVVDEIRDRGTTETRRGMNHRQLGVDLYNSSWALMEKAERTPEEDDELVHHVHASLYHWLQAPECEPKHRARGEWLCSRAYSVLGRGEPALHHAQRCLAICEQHADNVEDWDLAFAYEALARAHRVAGHQDEARSHEKRGRRLAERIEDPEDKEIVLRDYATLER